MPTLGAPLDFAKLEGRNFVAHQLSSAPSSPVKGQLYFNNTGGDNTLYWYDGSAWVSAKGGVASVPDASPSVKGIVQLAGDLSGTATSPQIASGAVTDTEVAAANKDGAAGTVGMRSLGPGAAQAAPGNDARFSDSRAPSGAAGGDLSGTYPNPQILTGTIVDADVAAANKDGAVATPSLRTLGAGAQQAMPGNRTLDAVTAPAADVSLNSKKIIGLADPIAATDGANKQYVDNIAQGLDAKASVKAASPGTVVTLSGPQTVDGVSLIAGDRVLVKNQSGPNGPDNGIYVVAAGAWARATDLNVSAEAVSAFVFVEQGTVNGDTGWVCTVNQTFVLGTDTMMWTQFSDATAYSAGGGLTLTGTVLDVGAGPGITVNADTVQVANNGITNAMIADGAIDLGSADVANVLPLANGGTGAAGTSAGGKLLGRQNLGAAGYWTQNTHGAGTTITIPQSTHGLRVSSGLMVQCQIDATGAVVLPDVVISSGGDVTVTFAVSQSANTIRITVIG